MVNLPEIFSNQKVVIFIPSWTHQ